MFARRYRWRMWPRRPACDAASAGTFAVIFAITFADAPTALPDAVTRVLHLPRRGDQQPAHLHAGLPLLPGRHRYRQRLLCPRPARTLPRGVRYLSRWLLLPRPTTHADT